jgi:hypothetical protein
MPYSIPCTHQASKRIGCPVIRASDPNMWIQIMCISKFMIKRQQELNQKLDLPWLSYDYQKRMFVGF